MKKSVLALAVLAIPASLQGQTTAASAETPFDRTMINRCLASNVTDFAAAIPACGALLATPGIKPAEQFQLLNRRASLAIDYAATLPKGSAQQNRNYADAERDLAAVIDNPAASAGRRSDSYAMRGAALHQRGNLSAAEAAYTASLAIFPKSATTLRRRSMVREDRKNYQGALADLNDGLAVLEQSSQSAITDRAKQAWTELRAEFLNARCWTNGALLKTDLLEARADCDDSIKLVQSSATFDSRGMVGLRQHNAQAAWNDYNTAVSLAPNSASAYYGRGLAALRLGRESQGNADLLRARQLDPAITRTYADMGLKP